MNEFLLFVTTFVISFYTLLIGFLIYCAVKPVWENLDKTEKVMLCPFLVFYIVDVLFNWIFGTIIFLEPPRQLTFTDRCASHMHDRNWKGTRARTFCKRMNLFDPNHCH